jgi:hypothetical protein
MQFDNDKEFTPKEYIQGEVVGYVFVDENIQIDEDEAGKQLFEQGQLYSIEKEDGHINVRYSLVDSEGEIQLRVLTNLGQAEFEEWVDGEPLVHIIPRSAMQDLMEYTVDIEQESGDVK